MQNLLQPEQFKIIFKCRIVTLLSGSHNLPCEEGNPKKVDKYGGRNPLFSDSYQGILLRRGYSRGCGRVPPLFKIDEQWDFKQGEMHFSPRSQGGG